MWSAIDRGFFAGFWGLDKAEKRGKSVSFPVRSLLWL